MLLPIPLQTFLPPRWRCQYPAPSLSSIHIQPVSQHRLLLIRCIDRDCAKLHIPIWHILDYDVLAIVLTVCANWYIKLTEWRARELMYSRRRRPRRILGGWEATRINQCRTPV